MIDANGDGGCWIYTAHVDSKNNLRTSKKWLPGFSWEEVVWMSRELSRRGSMVELECPHAPETFSIGEQIEVDSVKRHVEAMDARGRVFVRDLLELPQHAIKAVVLTRNGKVFSKVRALEFGGRS